MGVALAVLLGAWAARRPLLAAIPPLLVERQPPRRADALVVLAGDHTGGRVDAAAALFHEGYVPEGPVILSGGPIYGDTTWAELMRDRAVARGVPEARILLAARSATTLEDARSCRDMLEARGARVVLLVTSPWHSGRAAALFRRELGPDVEVVSCPGQNQFVEPWWEDAVATRALATELLKRVWAGPGS